MLMSNLFTNNIGIFFKSFLKGIFIVIVIIFLGVIFVYVGAVDYRLSLLEEAFSQTVETESTDNTEILPETGNASTICYPYYVAGKIRQACILRFSPTSRP